tara:strand:+ start:7080 stop:7334 length:255 start_codon:yes stop_codon:yes gene_type:complete
VFGLRGVAPPVNNKEKKMEKMKALRLRYEADMAASLVNLNNYKQNLVGVAEHPDVVASMDVLIEKIADAREKLAVVEDFISKKL